MNNREKKVTIVLPTFNGQKYLRQSIDSCLEQTYHNIELIVVNDGSSDGTHDIIASYDDSRIKYIINDKNKGLVCSLNEGFSSSTGSYLTWTSDDNYYSKNAIETMLECLLKHKRIDFVYARYYIINEEGDILRPGHVSPPKFLDYDNYVGGCFLYKRMVYEKLGNFNSDTFLVEDYEYWLRTRDNFRMKMINDFLYFYRTHSASLTEKYTYEKVQEQVEKVREKFISKAKSLYFKAKKYYINNDYQNARVIIKESIAKSPFCYESWRLLLLLYFRPTVINKMKFIKSLLRKK